MAVTRISAVVRTETGIPVLALSTLAVVFFITMIAAITYGLIQNRYVTEYQALAGEQQTPRLGERDALHASPYRISFSRRLEIRSQSYPSTSIRTSSVCWPSSGATLRMPPGVSRRRTGMPTIWVGPCWGCSTSTR